MGDSVGEGLYHYPLKMGPILKFQ